MSRSLRSRLGRLERADALPDAPRVDWDALVRGDPNWADGVPPPDPRRWDDCPAVRVLRGECARLGIPDPGGYEDMDVVAEALRLAAIPAPRVAPPPVSPC